MLSQGPGTKLAGSQCRSSWSSSLCSLRSTAMIAAPADSIEQWAPEICNTLSQGRGHTSQPPPPHHYVRRHSPSHSLQRFGNWKSRYRLKTQPWSNKTKYFRLRRYDEVWLLSFSLIALWVLFKYSLSTLWMLWYMVKVGGDMVLRRQWYGTKISISWATVGAKKIFHVVKCADPSSLLMPI